MFQGIPLLPFKMHRHLKGLTIVYMESRQCENNYLPDPAPSLETWVLNLHTTVTKDNR